MSRLTRTKTLFTVLRTRVIPGVRQEVHDLLYSLREARWASRHHVRYTIMTALEAFIQVSKAVWSIIIKGGETRVDTVVFHEFV